MYQAKTAAELSQSIRMEIKAEVTGSDPWIWPNNLYIAGKVFAQALRALYLRLEWIHKQRFVSKCDVAYLPLHGIEAGVTQWPAIAAIGDVDAVTAIGTEIPAGTALKRSDGVLFHTTSIAIAVSAATALHVAADEAGRDGNTDAGATLALIDPITGVGALIVAADGIYGGDEEENTETYRARILQNKSSPPRGGTPAEYVQWAREKPGVTRAFCARATPAAGSVTLYFMMDNNSVTGIPVAGDIADLQTRIEALAPAEAVVVVAAPVAVTVDITIQDLVPVSAQDSVAAEIAAMFRRRAWPGRDFSRSWIGEAISTAKGEVSHILTTPAADVSCDPGEIAVPGTISFT